MSSSKYFDPKKSLKLFGHKDNFNFLKNLLINHKLPQILLLSGEKGIGKSTLINHLMFYFYDNKNYNQSDNSLINESKFYKNFILNLYPNLIYLNGESFQKIKVEDIRKLKDDILKTPLNNQKRFIILDDIDLFNINSLNGLLKILEEPNQNNYFILIDNLSKPLLETVKSRCHEFKIMLNNMSRNEIIKELVKKFNQKIVFDQNILKTTPGNYIKYNYIFEKNKINLKDGYLINLDILLSVFKKEKDIFYKDLMIFFTEYYLKKMKNEKIYNYEKYIEKRSFLIKHINNFFWYNTNQKSLIRYLENKF